ncbi:edc-3 [Pristionchus pacificus]|uniref:DFDF domain-containing protein n=1 Tax=Pristionchus pacificus TaxID=54126 RepID=A0A8R1Z9K7_PRIPA|nr:edc-3 [Pristionchus pacificus]
MGDTGDEMKGMIGAVISVNCGDEGYYQGRLKAFCPSKKTITIDSPFKNGVPLGRDIELNASQIKGLKVIRAAGESPKPSTPQPSKPTTPQPVVQLKQQSASIALAQMVQLQQMQQQQKASTEPQPKPTVPKPPPTPQAVVLPLTHKPMDLADLEALYLKPALKSPEKKVSLGDQSDTICRTTEKRQTRFEEKQSWVSRPLAGQRRRRRSEDPLNSSARSSPFNASDDNDETLGIAPTPLFRKYEPQVANPTTLETRSMRYSSNRHMKRQAGPSGIPSVDAARGRVTGKASDLSRPLDMDLLDTDFDFESNLKLFNKETDVDDDFYETVEKPKMSVNYAHYENIIDDPTRCNSWTNMTRNATYSEYESEVQEERERRPNSGMASAKTHKSTPPRQSERRRSSMGKRIVVSHFVECADGGLKLPVLDEKEKARLAKETRSFLGEDAYSLILADRVLEWMFEVIASHELIVERVALLCADSTAQSLLDRILMQLSARGCRVSLYGATLEKALPLVELVASERDLPSDVQMIVDLDPSMQRKSRSAELTRWIDALNEAHIICLDHVCPGVTDYERVHALMVGALSTSVMETVNNASKVVPKVGPTSVAELFGTLAVASKQSRPHIGLADLGVPFAWFGDEASSALSSLFATTFVARCDLK